MASLASAFSTASYPDLTVEEPVIHVLIKTFLWVYIDAVSFQVFLDLGKQAQATSAHHRSALCTLTQLHFGHPDHPAPEGVSFFNGQAVSPGDHGHHIHSPAQPPQELNVQGP